MKRQLITYPNSILYQSTTDVSKYDAQLTQLIIDMFETMSTHKGIGLAAPQVGILKSVIVYRHKDIEGYLINPVLLEVDDDIPQYQPEGCLSLPNVFIRVERPSKIRVGYKDTDGSEKEIEASGELAQIICHEMDHLKGKTILDHLSPIKRDIVKRKLVKQNKRKKRHETQLKTLEDRIQGE